MASQWTGMLTTTYRIAIRVRLAYPSDDHQVAVMCRQRDNTGLDYLPHVYSQLLQQKHAICFVAHFGKKLVGFVAVSLVDDDTTAVCCTLREADDLRRLRLSPVFKSLVSQILKTNFPRLTRWSYSAIMDDNLTKLVTGDQVQVLDKWGVIVLQLDKLQLHLLMTTLAEDGLVRSARTRDVSMSEILVMLSTGQLGKLVAGERLYSGYNSRPSGLSVDTIKSLYYTHTFYTITATNCKALGTVYSHKCEQSIRSHLRYYGDCQLHLFLAFVLRGLVCIQKQAGSSGLRHVVEISHPLGINHSHIQAFSCLSHIKYYTYVYVNDETFMSN